MSNLIETIEVFNPNTPDNPNLAEIIELKGGHRGIKPTWTTSIQVAD